MNVVVSQNVVQGISAFVNYMRSIRYSSQMLMSYKNNMLMYLPNLVQNVIAKGPSANNRGYVYYRIPQNKNVWVFNFIFNPKNQVATIMGFGLRPLAQVNAVAVQEQEQQEKRRKIVRLTESDLKSIIEESVEKVLHESIAPLNAKVQKVGKYEAVDGMKLKSYYPGLEDKCPAYGLRTYYNEKEIYAIFQRCDNGRYFYGKVVFPKKGESYWVSLSRKSVPKVILNDFPQLIHSLHLRQEQAYQMLHKIGAL